MTYFWCEKHKCAHAKGDDTTDCLLVGPFPSKADAESWPARSDANSEALFCKPLTAETVEYLRSEIQNTGRLAGLMPQLNALCDLAASTFAASASAATVECPECGVRFDPTWKRPTLPQQPAVVKDAELFRWLEQHADENPGWLPCSNLRAVCESGVQEAAAPKQEGK